jgi:hypothetical protein
MRKPIKRKAKPMTVSVVNEAILQVRLPRELKAAVDALARRHGVSVSSFIRILLEQETAPPETAEQMRKGRAFLLSARDAQAGKKKPRV